MASRTPSEKAAQENAAEPGQRTGEQVLDGNGAAAPGRPATAPAVTGAKQVDRTLGHGNSLAGPCPIDAPDGPPEVSGHDRFDALLQSQAEILDFVVTGASLVLVLERVALQVERLARPALCSIHLLDPEGRALRRGATASLPADYLRLLDSPAVGTETTPCHGAARRRERIVAANLGVEARWPEFREGALANGVRAVCAQPILDRQGAVLGVLALHYKERHRADAGDHQIMDAMASLAGFAIRHENRERSRRSADERFASLASTIPGVVYQRLVTPDGDIRYTYISEGARTSSGSRRRRS